MRWLKIGCTTFKGELMNLESLLPKLLLITDWIDRTLAAYAKEARPVGSFEFKRLPDFYSAALLASAKVVAVARVPIPPLSALGLTEFADFERGHYRGITFKDTYFVERTQIDDESLAYFTSVG